MKMYSIVSVENLCLHEPPLINDQGSDIQLPSKRGSVDYLQIGLNVSKPGKERWMEVEKVREMFPHILNR